MTSRGRLLVFLILFWACSDTALSAEPMRALAMGTVLPQDTPVFHWCEEDPLCTITVIPTRLGGSSYEPEEAQRLIRLYFPRRLDETTIDCLLFSAGDVVHFTTSQIASMIRGVERGVGAVADCGGTSAIQMFIDSWVASGIGAIFPNDVFAVTSARYSFQTAGFPRYYLEGVPYEIRVNEGVEGNPFSPFVTVGIEGIRGYAGRNMIPKQGSTELATMIGNQGFLKLDPPFSLYWQYQAGRTLTVSEWFGHPFWGDYGGIDIHISENPFGRELFYNLLLYCTDRPIFRDILMIYETKEGFEEYRVLRSSVISAMEFASKFGANLDSVDEALGSIEGEKRIADQLYIDGEYQRSWEKIEACTDELNIAFQMTLELKDRALIYVYLIEWLAVTGTMGLTGSVLYMLMVRRRVYRRAGTTSTMRTTK